MLNIIEKTITILDELPEYLETIIKEYNDVQIYISNNLSDKISKFGFEDVNKYQIVKSEVTNEASKSLKIQKYYVLCNLSFNHSLEYTFSISENNKEYNQLYEFKHSDMNYLQLDAKMKNLVLIKIE